MWCQTWLQNVNQLQIKARRKINTFTTFFTFSHLRSWSVNSSLQWLSKLIKLWLVNSAAAKNQAFRVLWLTLAPRLAAPLQWCWLGFYAVKFKIRTLVLPCKLRNVVKIASLLTFAFLQTVSSATCRLLSATNDSIRSLFETLLNPEEFIFICGSKWEAEDPGMSSWSSLTLADKLQGAAAKCKIYAAMPSTPDLLYLTLPFSCPNIRQMAFTESDIKQSFSSSSDATSLSSKHQDIYDVTRHLSVVHCILN